MNIQKKNNHTLFGKVAVLMGGSSAEREISKLSGTAVLNALCAQGVNAFSFDPNEKDIFGLKEEGFARCFIALHGRYGEDGTVQGALELMGIPYTGSGVLASSVAMNKVMTKRIWKSMGLPTPDWAEVHSVEQTKAAFLQLGSPMIVKPGREGSTIGLTKVTSIDECEHAYKVASRQDSIVLCEEYITGDEVTCAILEDTSRFDGIATNTVAHALPIIKIIAPAGNYDYENKYFGNDTEYIVPCDLPAGEESNIQKIALNAYHALGCRGWARADVMIDKNSRQPYLLEINTAPGMTNHSLVPMSAKEIGLNFEMLCIRVLESAGLDYSSDRI